MPCDLIYGSLMSRGILPNYDCYCTYVKDLRNSMVDTYLNTGQCLGEAAITQKIYYDRDTTPHHFKKGDRIIIGINQPLCKLCLMVGQVLS